MAQVVRKLDPVFLCHEPRIGAVFKVVMSVFAMAPTRTGFQIPMPSWTYEGRAICVCCGRKTDVLADETLKPLPPPPDVDEHDKLTELDEELARITTTVPCDS